MQLPEFYRKIAKGVHRKMVAGTKPQQLAKLQKAVSLLLAQAAQGRLEWFRDNGLLPQVADNVCDRCGVAHTHRPGEDPEVELLLLGT